MAKPGKVLALVGAQYGSEGKGVIAAHIANDYQTHVRVGGPNAGHTFFHGDRKFVMQSIPCGWINPEAIVIIGPGGLVSLETLKKEIENIIDYAGASAVNRIMVDSNCGIISERHHREEGGVDGEMHQRIGSTGEGVGAARRDRMMRDPDRFQRMRDFIRQEDFGGEYWNLGDLLVDDTPGLLDKRREKGMNTLLEGTQGSGLSLIHGPWPYVTSSDTNAAQLCVDAGVAPNKLTSVLLVARTYPIRVAGNSGPLRSEISWEDLQKRIGRLVLERTTVTKKIRRVGEWDEDLIDRAVLLNGPTSMAITFVDYLSPEDEGKTDEDELSQRTLSFCEYIETRFGVPVSLVSTGGEKFSVVTICDWL